MSKKDQNKGLAEQKKKEKEQKIVYMVKDMYNRGVNAKAPFVSKWKDYIDAYKGGYLEQKLPSYKSNNVCNYIFSTIETIRPIMVSENPKFQVMPRLEKDFNKAHKVQQALDYEWKREKMSTKIAKAILPMLQIGTSILYLPWIPKDKNIGNIKPTIISPFNFFVDPSATDLEDAEWVIYATYKNVGQIIKMFPDKKEELLKEAGSPKDEDLLIGQDSSVMSNNQVLVYEVYMQDYSTEDTIEEEEGKKYKVTKMKYPNGRRIQIAGDVLLSDGKTPYEDGRFPFVVFKCYDLPDQFWGMGEVEQLLSPQLNVNQLINQVLDNAKMTANSQWIMDKNAGVDTKKLTNRPGLIIKKNPGTEVRREQPGQIPAYIQNTIEVLKRDIEVISGVFDVTRGEKPSGITAGVAINQLTESAQARIKLKIQLLEFALADLGSMWVSRIKQFWKMPRQMRVMMTYRDIKEQERQQQMMMQGQMMGNAQQMQDFALNDEENQPIINLDTERPVFTSLSGDEIDGDWDIYVVGGSTMPVNKNARLQQYVQLAQTPAEDGKPMIDRKTVLSVSEIPNVEEILERFNVQEQKEQQMAEQQRQTELNNNMEQQMMAMMQQQASQQPQMQAQGQGGQMPQQGQGDSMEIPEEGQKIEQLLDMLEQLPPEAREQLFEQYPELRELIDSIANNQ